MENPEKLELVNMLSALVAGRNFSELRKILADMAPPDLAETITALGRENEAVVFRILPRDLATDVFEYLPLEAQEDLLKSLAAEDVAAILNDMSPDDRTALLEELPANATKQLLTLLSPEERAVANQLLGYPDESVGRLMTPDYLSIKENWMVEEVLAYVRKYGRDTETLNVLYVIDENGKLTDDIRIREFLLVSPDTKVSSLMDRQFVSMLATDDQETAVVAFRKHDRTALPVTDASGVLVGIVTVDDVLDIAEQEATEDIQKLGGSEAFDEPYLTITVPKMIRKRASWLILLFFGQMLTATAMDFFESELAQALVLAIFIPLIISSGGNSGSQAATLVIRAMTLGEVTLTDWWKVMRREIISGAAIGMLLGALGFLRVSIWQYAFNEYGVHWILIGITVWVSLTGVVLWGTLSGFLLPFFLRRIGVDPAASSAPFVATIVDVTGLVIYFSVATVILKGSLL